MIGRLLCCLNLHSPVLEVEVIPRSIGGQMIRVRVEWVECSRCHGIVELAVGTELADVVRAYVVRQYPDVAAKAFELCL